MGKPVLPKMINNICDIGLEPRKILELCKENYEIGRKVIILSDRRKSFRYDVSMA